MRFTFIEIKFQVNYYFDKIFKNYFSANRSASSWIGHSGASPFKGSQAILVSMDLGLPEVLKELNHSYYHQHHQHNFKEDHSPKIQCGLVELW